MTDTLFCRIIKVHTEGSKMYEANGQMTDSFLGAIKIAKLASCNVIEVETGIVRWSPAPAPSAKKMRHYEERKAAYEAYQKSLTN